jgi:hypothetical protein
MLPLERRSGASVVEALQVSLGPGDHVEGTAGVIGMAARACPRDAGVQAPLLLLRPGNFRVTVQASRVHSGTAAPAMALETLGRTLERLVRGRKRPR